MKKLFILLIFTVLLYTGCKDEDDDVFVISSELEVQDFIWNNLNFWYFWQADVPDLADERFSSDMTYASYLSDFSDPRMLFEQLLYVDDRFSYITSDYNELLNSQQGIFKTNGVEFGLIRPTADDDLFGYVRYILPNSDAADKNIQRGDVFIAVDDTPLTIHNFVELLFGPNDNYTLNMADINDGVVAPNDIDVALTKTEYTENPVFIAKTLDIEGQNIGYLMYNSFINGFENELNDAFGQFKVDNITDLVLDLRYNPGGAVSTAVRLAGMINGSFEGQLFARERWNDKLQPLFSSEQLDNDFTAQLEDGSPLNSLNLNRIYVLTTDNSASASELLINGLRPYINVIQIGATTRGKNEASITVLDYIDVDDDDEAIINPNHTWAMQPLVLRLENSNGFSDYTDGLSPDIFLEEDIARGNLGELGDPSEPLLAEAIAQITGGISKATAARKSNNSLFYKEVSDSKRFTPTGDRMYIDEFLKISPQKQFLPQ